jgi:hypothetical protein
VLAKVFDQALAGGGAKGINFQELAADLAQITFDYPFRIPPYFALIIRAIGVLEGIALVGDPDFAIVDEVGGRRVRVCVCVCVGRGGKEGVWKGGGGERRRCGKQGMWGWARKGEDTRTLCAGMQPSPPTSH